MAEFKIEKGPELDYYATSLCWLGITRRELAALRTIVKREDFLLMLGHFGSCYQSEESPEIINFAFTLMTEREVSQELIDRIVSFIDSNRFEN
ncbi:hypothetical protein GCM10027592_08460 [Spirosoma flavus]